MGNQLALDLVILPRRPISPLAGYGGRHLLEQIGMPLGSENATLICYCGPTAVMYSSNFAFFTSVPHSLRNIHPVDKSYRWLQACDELLEDTGLPVTEYEERRVAVTSYRLRGDCT